MEDQPEHAHTPGPSIPQKKGLSQKQIGTIVIGVIAVIVVAILLLATLNGPDDASKVKIVVKTSGSWTGSYGELGSYHAWSGTGDRTVVYTIEGTSEDTDVVANAFSNSLVTITIQIVSMDGRVLAESTSTGAAMVSWTP